METVTTLIKNTTKKDMETKFQALKDHLQDTESGMIQVNGDDKTRTLYSTLGDRVSALETKFTALDRRVTEGEMQLVAEAADSACLTGN